MTPDVQVRQPGSSLPEAVRDAAVRAGGRFRPTDLVVLARLRDALARLSDQAPTRSFFEIPGDCLAFPRESRQTL
jgi:hypothetical protein